MIVVKVAAAALGLYVAVGAVVLRLQRLLFAEERRRHRGEARRR